MEYSDIPAVVDSLSARGVFETATLLDPFTLTWVTLNLAATSDPNEYFAWLKLYAAMHGVSTTDLARNCLVVLANSGEHVHEEIAERAKRESRQLELMAA